MNIELRDKDDCVHYWVETRFDNIDSTMVTDFDEWHEHYEFYGTDEDNDYEVSWHYYAPMWNTWFEPSDCFLRDWLEEHRDEVVECGFTLIYRDDEFWGLGVDGAGYSFYDEHWEPLYDLFGIKWHEN